MYNYILVCFYANLTYYYSNIIISQYDNNNWGYPPVNDTYYNEYSSAIVLFNVGITFNFITFKLIYREKWQPWKSLWFTCLNIMLTQNTHLHKTRNYRQRIGGELFFKTRKMARTQAVGCARRVPWQRSKCVKSCCILRGKSVAPSKQQLID